MPAQISRDHQLGHHFPDHHLCFDLNTVGKRVNTAVRLVIQAKLVRQARRCCLYIDSTLLTLCFLLIEGRPRFLFITCNILRSLPPQFILSSRSFIPPGVPTHAKHCSPALSLILPSIRNSIRGPLPQSSRTGTCWSISLFVPGTYPKASQTLPNFCCNVDIVSLSKGIGM